MPGLSSADHRVSPPRVNIPRDYNAAYDLIERNLGGARGQDRIHRRCRQHYLRRAGRTRQPRGQCTGRVGLGLEDRIMLAHLDTIDFPSVFLGAIKAGIVPIAGNTLLTTADYEFMLNDSRAKALVVSEAVAADLCPAARAAGKLPFLKHVIVSGKDAHGHLSLAQLMRDAGTALRAGADHCDDACFWLYSSGSTGMPKGTVHIHSHLIQTAELYARPMLGIREERRRVLGGEAVLRLRPGQFADLPDVGRGDDRPDGRASDAGRRVPAPATAPADDLLWCADAVCGAAGQPRPAPNAKRSLCASAPRRARRCRPTSASAGPGISASKFSTGSARPRCCTSSCRTGRARCATARPARPVPGYALRVVDDSGKAVTPGEIGELQINGPTSAACYWNNRAKSRATFLGDWTRAATSTPWTRTGITPIAAAPTTC